jgi:hypothetical protein
MNPDDPKLGWLVCVEGDERDRCGAVATAVWPNYDEYAKRTTRVIPVVVLERTDG